MDRWDIIWEKRTISRENISVFIDRLKDRGQDQEYNGSSPGTLPSHPGV